MRQNTVEFAPVIDGATPPTGQHLFPWWAGYLLSSPLRRLLENPEKLLSSFVSEGMTVLDMGCAMGFFSIPIAKMVGKNGRVVCVDVQERMIRVLRNRARRRKLDDVIETRPCTQEESGTDDLAGKVDLVLAFHVVHETTDPKGFLGSCYAALKPGGKLVLLEPDGHVSDEVREFIFDLALSTGFTRQTVLSTRRSQGAVYVK
jgi:2-polyprenyl-3-methyl-5-hydroxy-6-metoxy-1,4-benzoquinol methylase